MKVLFIYRHPDMGFSIGRVFAPIEAEMRAHCEVDAIYLPVANYSPKGLLRNIRAARKQCRTTKYDIVHITGAEHYLLPFLRGENCVVTVHDIMYYSYLSGVKKRLWRSLFIDSLKCAKGVTFISEYSKQQVFDEITLDVDKVEVIPNPVSPEFVYTPKEFCKKRPTILHIGTLERKNLCRSIEAMAGIACHLRVVGSVGEKEQELLSRLNIDYSIVSNLSDEEIIKEYESCDIVNFPSTYEGFGMPVLEGQAVGRLVLTSNISPMRDICGKGAYLVDPYSMESIREGYKAIIEGDARREEVVIEGLNNVKSYSIEVVTKRYYQLYKSILQQ